MAEKLSYPDYDTLADRLLVANTADSPALIHGMLTGMLCTSCQPATVCWQQLKAELPALKQLATKAEATFETLTNQTEASFKADGQGITPILPDQEAPLGARLSALSDWCKGFIDGLTIGIDLNKMMIDLNAISEVLEDFTKLREVAQDEPATDENEQMYRELVEYIKMGALLVFTECQQAKQKH